MSTLPNRAQPADAEVEALRWSPLPGAIHPDYGRSLTGITPTLLKVLGNGQPGWDDLTPFLPEISPQRAKRVFLLCLDGLGFHELIGAERLHALHRDWGTWITSVFPSITSAAITSIYQGLPPARHGILGHHIWKDLPGGIVDMLRMAVPGAPQPLAASGFDVRRWQREPGRLAGAPLEGLDAVQLMPAAIVGSGLSNYCYGDARLLGFLEPVEGFAKAAHLLGEMQRGFVGMYLSSVDSLTHVFGTSAEPTRFAARHVEQGLAWMASQLDPGVLEETALMIVTDHGQINVERRVQLEGPAWDHISGVARAIGFSGRVMHLYLDDPDGETAQILPALEELMAGMGKAFLFEDVRELVGPRDSAPSAGQSGEQAVRESLGDIVAILENGADWHKSRPDAQPFPYGTPLMAHHGGLSPAEMLVPLILSPLSVLLEG